MDWHSFIILGLSALCVLLNIELRYERRKRRKLMERFNRMYDSFSTRIVE